MPTLKATRGEKGKRCDAFVVRSFLVFTAKSNDRGPNRQRLKKNRGTLGDTGHRFAQPAAKLLSPPG